MAGRGWPALALLAACSAGRVQNRLPTPAPVVSASVEVPASVPPDDLDGIPPRLCRQLVHRETTVLTCDSAPPSLLALEDLRVLAFSEDESVEGWEPFSLSVNPNLRAIDFEGVPTANQLVAVGELNQLRSLTIRGRRSPVDLTPLADQTGLEELDARRTTVVGLHALLNKPHLAVVRIQADKQTDLTPLASLPGLELLSLATSDGVDLRPLAKLPETVHVDLWASRTVDDRGSEALARIENLKLYNANPAALQAVAKMRGLHRLAAHDAGYSLASLARLPALEELELTFVNKPALDSLSAFTNLESLQIVAYDPQELDLSRLSNLQRLDLHSLMRVKGLDKLKRLREVTLRGSTMSLKPLAAMPHLEHLRLFGVHRELAALRDAPLRSLDIRGATVDLTEVAPLRSLRRLTCSAEVQGDLKSMLDKLPQLRSLILHGARLDEAMVLSNVGALRELELHGRLRSTAGLAGMVELETLTISSDIEVDLSGLEKLTKLRRLRLVATNPRPGSLGRFRRALPGCRVEVVPAPREDDWF